MQEQQKLLTSIILNIHKFTRLSHIFQTAVQGIRELLAADRVVVYQFDIQMNGEIVAESVLPEWTSCINLQIEDTCFRENRGIAYQQGKICAISDIYQGGLSDCHIKLLERFQIKANLVVPILIHNNFLEYENLEDQIDQNLWGLLIVHQCGVTRDWQNSEVDFLQQISIHLSLAIQQVHIYQQSRNVSVVLEKKVQDRTKHLESAIKDLEYQSQVLAKIDNAVISTDINGMIISWNNAAEQIYEYKASEAIGSNVAMLYFPEDLECLQSLVFEPLLRKGNHEIELRNRTKSGRRIYVDLRLSVIKDDLDNIVSVLGCSSDITERKQAQAKYQSLIEQIPGVVYTSPLTATTKHAYISPQIQSLLGVSQEVWEAGFLNSWSDHVHPEDRDWVLEKFRDSVANKTLFQAEYRMITVDGRIIWIKDTARLALADDDQTWILQGLAIDVTNRKQAEANLIESNHNLAITNAKLAHATRLKDEFLANMSHELRTPLNAILGMSENLQEQVFGPIREEQKLALQTIEQSGTHLLELINDILDLAKIESGQINLNCSLVNIAELCQSTINFVKQQSIQKNIRLELKIEPNLPRIFCDQRRIRQVLINLFNNAVKFTDSGGSVALEVTHHHTGSSSLIRIAVIDTGIGIAAENINKLFQSFVQIDSALNRQYSGTGLGLSLVKKIVEMHGGNVGVQSEFGVGSTFVIDLPINFLPSEPDAVPNEFNLQSLAITEEILVKTPSILLAEDNEFNIATIASYLTAKGYRITLAKNGQEAIDQAISLVPDLILMDIQMPGINGLEAITRLRLEPRLLDTPIIALTALAMPGDRERCLEVGANEYLTKPVKLSHLHLVIQQFLTVAPSPRHLP